MNVIDFLRRDRNQGIIACKTTNAVSLLLGVPSRLNRILVGWSGVVWPY